VEIAETGDRFKPGICYIGEPAGHLTLAARNYAHLIDNPANLYRNRTIDALFSSVAKFDGHNMIGVILSGSSDDGSRGLAEIKKAGVTTMVLTSENPLYKGMPENAAALNAPIDKIGTPKELGEEIGRLIAR
jgi:two-component system, chemotaxis family, protein-glutamate methylesterase/glutaminase